MKQTKLSALVVAGGLCFLPAAAFSADAETEAAPETAPVADSADANTSDTEQAEEMMTLSVVVAKGGGWGATRRVREALNAQEGVKKLLLSGLRGAVLMEEGKELDEEKVKKALEANRMSFVSLEVLECPVPKAAYILQAGTGWASTADKARAALEKLDGVALALVNTKITLLMSEDKPLDEEAVKTALEPLKIKVRSVAKASTLPL